MTAGISARGIVKRYHAPGPLDRLRDPARARREFETLGLLHAAGLPVPRPLGVERTEAGVELTMEHVAEIGRAHV